MIMNTVGSQFKKKKYLQAFFLLNSTLHVTVVDPKEEFT